MHLARKRLPSHNPRRKFGSIRGYQMPGSYRAPRLCQRIGVHLERDIGGVENEVYNDASASDA